MTENDLENLPPEPGTVEDREHGVSGLEHLAEPPENDQELGDAELAEDEEENNAPEAW